MYNLVNSNFNRTYNPIGNRNALSDIKRLLTSRDTVGQTKACGYVIEVIKRYHVNSEERVRMIEYLLENDIVVFLCEATSNLSFPLFRLVLECMRLLWNDRRFFSEEHAAHAMAAVLRSLSHYSATKTAVAVDSCLHFLCDFLNGVSSFESTSVLSHQSPYSIEQLLACLHDLGSRICGKTKTILSSALVLDALISYQPKDLDLRALVANKLFEVVNKWFDLLLGSMKHQLLLDDNEEFGMFLVVMSQIGIDILRYRIQIAAPSGFGRLWCLPPVFNIYWKMSTTIHHISSMKQLCCVSERRARQMVQLLTQRLTILRLRIDYLHRLMKVLDTDEHPTNFVQTIVADSHEVLALQQGLVNMRTSILRDISEIVVLVKDNQEKINNDEYSVFLKFLLTFLTENPKLETLSELCDVLLTNGYLAILPQYQMIRNDNLVRKVSTLILGEVLKFLTQKYLISPTDTEPRMTDIQMDLVVVQYGIERPDNIGVQLQKSQPYSLLIYMYFYCQSSEKPEECTAPLLPHLVEYVLRLPKSFKPPLYIVKALWLVFAMSAVSNGTTESLDERISLEKATDRLVVMVHPNPGPLYTHHPAILLWAFTSIRIPYTLRLNVLSQWLATENTLPEEISKESMVWELLLNVLIRNTNETTVSNCEDALNTCLENDDIRQEFGNLAWSMIPSVLSRTLIDSDEVINPNICYLLEITTSQQPATLEQADCLKIAVLITTLFSKNNTDSMELDSRYRYECASLKLCLMLLEMSQEQNDNKILLTFVNRAGFLPSILKATESVNDDVACSALQLLSYIVMYFTKNKYQAKAILQIQTDNIIKSLRHDSVNDRGVTLLHLICMVLSSAHTPLVFTQYISVQPSGEQQCNALRALLFRVQMLCCENMENQSPMGWKALNSIFKHAIVYQNNPQLVATLSTQPWTFLLIRFQLTQNTTKEFLTFTHNWLTLLRITISKSPVNFTKYSLVRRTLVMIKTNLKNEDCEKVFQITNEILNDCNGME